MLQYKRGVSRMQKGDSSQLIKINVCLFMYFTLPFLESFNYLYKMLTNITYSYYLFLFYFLFYFSVYFKHVDFMLKQKLFRVFNVFLGRLAEICN